eukprot:3643554-Pleurochrysis_carterae.AAC.4
MSKSDLSLLNAAAGEITQEALIRNVNNDLQAEAAVEEAQQAALAAAAEKQLQIDDDNDDDFDDFANDPEVQSLQEKRLAALKARYMEEKAYHMQGHGEYREIVEEEFLKEVCASDNVVVHFYHNEFFRCKVIDKHMRTSAQPCEPFSCTDRKGRFQPPLLVLIETRATGVASLLFVGRLRRLAPLSALSQVIAPKHKRCKFLYLNAEKAPFFVDKLMIRMCADAQPHRYI